MSEMYSGFDNWQWSDPAIAGEVTSESVLEQGLNSVLGIARDVVSIRGEWFGATNPIQTAGIERPENVNGYNVGGANSVVWYRDPLKLAAAGAAAFLVYKLVK